MDIPKLFQTMPSRYITGKADKARTFYFSIGEHKYTVKISPQSCEVEEGKTTEQSDVILKTTPEIFEKMLVKGKLPGPLEIATGKVKTNDPVALNALRGYFDFSGL